MYKVYLYRKEKLLSVFNDRGFSTKEEIYKNLGYWFEVTRNDQSAQFIIINKDTDVIEGLVGKTFIKTHNETTS